VALARSIRYQHRRVAAPIDAVKLDTVDSHEAVS
jgi:hypothetical protein